MLGHSGSERTHILNYYTKYNRDLGDHSWNWDDGSKGVCRSGVEETGGLHREKRKSPGG